MKDARQKTKRKRLAVVLAVVLTACALLPFGAFGCVTPDPPVPPVFVDDPYDLLRTDGDKIRDGYGREVTLAGVNAGGYLVIEQWMTALTGSAKTGYLDHKKLTEILVEKHGAQQTLTLWQAYRDAFWTDADFINCRDMGFNVIRLPFSYMNCDPAYRNVAAIGGQRYNLSLLDDFVNRAKKFGLYTILDMHGAYGSQNGQDHSGESQTLEEVDFYSNAEKQEKTLDLWTAIARHFKDNPYVAGYDFLNEPAEKGGTTSKRHWDFFDKAYRAIRAEDDKHIVIFESCWDGPNLPQTDVYGWENAVYSFHHYTSYDGLSHMDSMRAKLDNAEAMRFGVPLYMGEFTCYMDEADWVGTLSLFKERGWHFTSWSYKVNQYRENQTPPDSAWGIYLSNTERVVPDAYTAQECADLGIEGDLTADTFEQILEKWSRLKTDGGYITEKRFGSGLSLKEVFTQSLLTP